MNIILFDGVCNLCNGVVRFIIAKDKSRLFRFAAIQSPVGQSMIDQYAARDKPTVTIYYIRDGNCFQKSTAILYILKDLGGVWRCFYPLIFIPSFIRDAMYLLLSRNRYRLFGKRESCMTPSPEIKERFM